ncbi:Kinase-like protein [Mycena kentingensis (nom. inval.)]|nr:Kinase-like protein [Mycena kentingensis (nom. inval.)]
MTLQQRDPPPKVIIEERSLGSGATSRVYPGTVESTGKVIAVKQSRISLRVARPFLQHEVRILHLLQGHRAIPELFGYYRGPHFEYIGMELLGASLSDLVLPSGGRALKAETVASVCVQMISALKHLLDKGVVHRDVKPSNILLCPTDPTAVRLVDYGFSSLTSIVRPRSACSAPIIGTLAYCSIHVHDQRWPLQPSDDLESLIYTLLFLLGGSLPWDDGAISARKPACVAHVASLKRAFTTTQLDPTESPLAIDLGRVLRRLDAGLKPEWSSVVMRVAAASACPSPLDCTPISPPPALRNLLSPSEIPKGPSSRGTAPRRYADSNSALEEDEWVPGRERPTDLSVPPFWADTCDLAVPWFYADLPECIRT